VNEERHRPAPEVRHQRQAPNPKRQRQQRWPCRPLNPGTVDHEFLVEDAGPPPRWRARASLWQRGSLPSSTPACAGPAKLPRGSGCELSSRWCDDLRIRSSAAWPHRHRVSTLRAISGF